MTMAQKFRYFIFLLPAIVILIIVRCTDRLSVHSCTATILLNLLKHIFFISRRDAEDAWKFLSLCPLRLCMKTCIYWHCASI
jgi:hypothetical protein